MQRGRLHLLLIPAAAFIAVLPLIINGCSCGHDFDFHILNWLEAARQFTHGNFIPHWAYTPAWNAGEPRFVFYPPISWTLGAVLGLLFPWSWAPILYTFLVLTAAGFAFYRLARLFAHPAASLFAAVFYTVNPYALFTAYERTAYAELFAAILLPILFHSILRPPSQGPITIPRIAIPIALLWLTNAPAAVMGCYAFAFLAIFRTLLAPVHPPLDPRTAKPITQSRLAIALISITGGAIGICAAAFYVIPAAVERHYVHINMVILFGLRIEDNTLFHTTAVGLNDPTLLADAIDHDQVLRSASWLAVFLILLTAIALFFALRNTYRPKGRISSVHLANQRNTLLCLSVLALLIAFFLTRPSLIFWDNLPELHYLQFPWRLLVVLAPILALAVALAIPAGFTHIILNRAITALVLPVVIAPLAYYYFRQGCDTEDLVSSITTTFHSSLDPMTGTSHGPGFSPTDEYTPIAADNDLLRRPNPPYWLSLNPNADAPANYPPGPAPSALTFRSPIAQTLILNLRDYPTWSITLNDALVMTRYYRPDGLIAIPIPAGRSTLSISYHRLRDQTAGNSITILSLVILITLIYLPRFKTKPPPRHRHRLRRPF
jgi:hypothetical protein